MKKLVLVLPAVVGTLLAADPASSRPPRDAASRAADLCPADVPAAVVPAADQRLRFMRAATGVQIYVCNATPAGGTAWQFLAPQAALFDEDGAFSGTHFIGPYWQEHDGSAVKAARLGGATVDAASIPWLLLQVVSQEGDGRYSGITTIQRLNTQGGLPPPASQCTPSTVGTVAQVPYTTEYFFYDTHPTNGTNAQCR